MYDLLSALGYGIAYAILGSVILAGSFYLLDLITPRHHIGSVLMGNINRKPSYSAAVVTSAWLIGQGLIIFTAIWTNASSSFGHVLLWTAAFGIVGALLLAATFFIHDLLTPGSLEDEVCKAGPALPLAYSTGASLLAISAIVCASIA
jgi:uncharacterized membrane protein YjfL (UPF0719 family)